MCFLMAVLRFFQRRWFNRVWVIQEVALSDRIMVLWGDEKIGWDVLQRIALFLCRATKLGQLLIGEDATNREPVDPIQKLYGLCLLREQCHPVSGPQDRDYLRDDLWRITGDASIRPASLVMNFALTHRSYKSTDPRDKIFGLLGIVNHIVQVEHGNEHSHASITVDYGESNTAAMVYEKLCSQTILLTQSLSILVCPIDPPESRSKSLPSWCPDLAISRGISTLQYISPPVNASKRYLWDDDGNMIHERHGITIENRQLNVKAILQARIATLVVHSDAIIEGTVEPWAPLLLTQSLVYSHTGEHRVEAFWRTLLMNADAHKIPAQWPQFEPGEPFRAFVFSQVWRQYQEAKQHGIHWDQFAQRLAFIDELATSDPAGHMPSMAEAKRQFQKMGYFHLKHQPFLSKEQESLQRGYQLRAMAYADSLDVSLAGKRFIISDKGHFALAPSWSEEGDTIALLSCCPCPLVIRTHPERVGCWSILGPAYVHGIMYGEAVDETLWRDICVA